jgi:hypothetical protein
MTFHYSNLEISHNGNKKTVRRVFVKNKKGYKSISKYINGKLKKTVKRRLKSSEIGNIKEKKFIPDFFNNCRCII